jgi:hypothetical protein
VAVITISPREALPKVEQLARARLARDGIVEVAAKSADRRQVRQLRKFAHRLAADGGLWVFGLTDRGDGGTYVMIFPAGSGGAWRSGEAKIDAADDGLDYWGMPFEPEAG